MEIGVYTFAETTPDPQTGAIINSARRLRDLMEEIELATKLASTFSASANIIAPTFLSRRLRSFSRPRPSARKEFG